MNKVEEAFGKLEFGIVYHFSAIECQGEYLVVSKTGDGTQLRLYDITLLPVFDHLDTGDVNRDPIVVSRGHTEHSDIVYLQQGQLSLGVPLEERLTWSKVSKERRRELIVNGGALELVSQKGEVRDYQTTGIGVDQYLLELDPNPIKSYLEHLGRPLNLSLF